MNEDGRRTEGSEDIHAGGEQARTGGKGVCQVETKDDWLGCGAARIEMACWWACGSRPGAPQ